MRKPHSSVGKLSSYCVMTTLSAGRLHFGATKFFSHSAIDKQEASCPSSEYSFGRKIKLGLGELCLLLPIMENGIKANCSQCQSWFLYCFTEVVNSSSFDTDNSVFFASLVPLLVSMLCSNKINCGCSTWAWRLSKWYMAAILSCVTLYVVTVIMSEANVLFNLCFFFREPTWQIFAQSCCFMEISLKSQQAISRNVSSSCSTTFWFTVRESPGKKINFWTTIAATTTACQRRRNKKAWGNILTDRLVERI